MVFPDLPQTADAELVELGVDAEEDEPFDLGLRGEKAVERIAVFGGERAGTYGMLAGNRKQGEAEIVN